jgi:hypothetical protein
MWLLELLSDSVQSGRLSHSIFQQVSLQLPTAAVDEVAVWKVFTESTGYELTQ